MTIVTTTKRVVTEEAAISATIVTSTVTGPETATQDQGNAAPTWTIISLLPASLLAFKQYQILLKSPKMASYHLNLSKSPKKTSCHLEQRMKNQGNRQNRSQNKKL